MSTHTCPQCAHTWTEAPARKAKAPELAPNLDAMTDAELFAYRKRTGPVEDARFFVHTQAGKMSNTIACQIGELIMRNPPRPQFLRELYQLQVAHWRTVPFARFEINVERERQQRTAEIAAAEAVLAKYEPEDTGESYEDHYAAD